MAICFTISVYALTNHFNFDSSKLSFSVTGKKKDITNSFNKNYALKSSIVNENKDEEDKIKLLAKRTTSLLIGEINMEDEDDEHYYKREKEYYDLAAYKYFPKNPNPTPPYYLDVYDETVKNYNCALASELAIPQIFHKVQEKDIVYHSYGDIKVSFGDETALAVVTLPNVQMKEEKELNSREYEIVTTNLIFSYHYVLIDGEYRLWNLYGSSTDDLNEYFNTLENTETKTKKLASTSYKSDLANAYDFSKVNKIPEKQFTKIYDDNIKNIVYLASYYNNQKLSSANGIFINNGLIATTWDFMEQALTNSQYIVVKDYQGNVYELDGIVTANPETDIVILKTKTLTNSHVTLGDTAKMKAEEPAIIISSKTGTGYITQKGIVIASDNYLQTSIPTYDADQGSPVFNEKGEVIGLNTTKSSSSLISQAINTSILKEAQDIFSGVIFNKIETISFEKLKEDFYYLKYDDEKVVSSIPKSKWKKYSKIGDLEKNIHLELVKASYKDGIVSLRYKNTISKYINSMQLSAVFREQLLQDGYHEVLNSSSKCIYQNAQYKVIIMDEFDYLIIVMVKL